MQSKEIVEELKRLDFEDFLWVLFAILSILNISGDFNEKEFLITDDKKFQNNSNFIFEVTLIVTFFIYLYFLIRNFKFYEKAPEDEKQLFFIKLLGSSFLIAGVICLIYFQTKQTSFVGSPAL